MKVPLIVRRLQLGVSFKKVADLKFGNTKPKEMMRIALTFPLS